MGENQLSEEKSRKIQEIMEQWEKEIKQMEEDIPPPDGKHFDGPRTWARVKLEKKYMPMIQEILNE